MNKNIITDHNTIIDFLSCKGTDHANRFLYDYWTISNKDMELCHDRIQWLFPLHEASKMAHNFPVIDKSFILSLDSITLYTIQFNLIKNTTFFLRFLGINNDIVELISTYDPKFNPDQINDILTLNLKSPLQNTFVLPYWLHNGDHNLLRITRMLRSLRLFNLGIVSHILFGKVFLPLAESYLNYKTKDFWTKAVSDDPWLSLQS